jgi:hypothetical protein
MLVKRATHADSRSGTVKVTTVFVQVLREDEFNILGKLAISILGTVRS